RALELEPRDVAAWTQCAAAERALGRHDDAARSCERALEIDPRNRTALNDGGAALAKIGRFEEALELFDRLVKVDPDSASAHTNRGKVLAEMGRYEEACSAYKRALVANPNHAPTWNSLGVARAALGRYAEAIDAYESASLGENQNFDAGHPLFNKATALLLLGDYPRGFDSYAQRFAAKATNQPPRVEEAPRWDGERVDGVMRVRGEQGVGDQLLFTRLLPLVVARTPRVAVDCDPRIASLLKRAYPRLESVLAPSEIARDVRAHIAMGDIAGVLKLGPKDIAALPVAMSADAEQTREFRVKYEALANGRPIVGIAWASPRAKLARSKSAALEHWGALLREPYFFVSLQYGDNRADIEAAEAAFGCEIHRDENVDQLRSIEDFAAQLAALDCIVTVSNTTAHVAGALGLKCLVLVPPTHGLHWYWGVEGATTPWYPTLSLVRRALGAPWDEQIAEAAGAVRTALLP
ncbi:MAG TPA: tetratricopeptide repeat-containing glycosyltransferase family protein, partial [Candidatus Binatia bacterium]|nr:tetratricopeptide repeat-containing glycosyltransferase family protein [Candidatus Binatia bacterium]